MRVSYAGQRIICWIVFTVSLLVLISGFFTLPSSLFTGAALLLIGAGLAAPAAWWWRQVKRGREVRLGESSVIIAAIPILAFSLSAILLANIAPAETVLEDDERPTPRMTTVRSELRTLPGPPASSPKPVVTSSNSPPPVLVEETKGREKFTITMTETETLKLVAPTVTVTSYLPVSPSHQETSARSQSEQYKTETLDFPEPSEPVEAPTSELSDEDVSVREGQGGATPDGQ